MSTTPPDWHTLLTTWLWSKDCALAYRERAFLQALLSLWPRWSSRLTYTTKLTAISQAAGMGNRTCRRARSAVDAAELAWLTMGLREGKLYAFTIDPEKLPETPANMAGHPGQYGRSGGESANHTPANMAGHPGQYGRSPTTEHADTPANMAAVDAQKTPLAAYHAGDPGQYGRSTCERARSTPPPTNTNDPLCRSRQNTPANMAELTPLVSWAVDVFGSVGHPVEPGEAKLVVEQVSEALAAYEPAVRYYIKARAVELGSDDALDGHTRKVLKYVVQDVDGWQIPERIWAAEADDADAVPVEPTEASGNMAIDMNVDDVDFERPDVPPAGPALADAWRRLREAIEGAHISRANAATLFERTEPLRFVDGSLIVWCEDVVTAELGWQRHVPTVERVMSELADQPCTLVVCHPDNREAADALAQ